jgi:peptidoglycan hydrolase-like protein with peptidoglycan-binding domain
MQGLGMPTTTITHQQRLGQVKYEFDTYYKDQTTQLVREYQQARKDGKSVNDIMSDWRDLQDARVRNGYARQPVSMLIKAAQQQQKYERATAGGVEFTKANKRFVQEQANL